jgi:hypothetical protein
MSSHSNFSFKIAIRKRVINFLCRGAKHEILRNRNLRNLNIPGLKCVERCS